MQVGLFLCLFLAAAQAKWVEQVRTATLSGGQVVPIPGSDAAYGTCVAVLDPNLAPVPLDVEISSNVLNIISITIHLARRGEAGPVLVCAMTFLEGIEAHSSSSRTC